MGPSVEEANQTWYRTKNVSFSVGIQMLDDEISSQTYGKGISRLRSDQCFMYYRRIISPLCMSRKLFSPPLCCSAVREAIDEGRCLCEPRVSSTCLYSQILHMRMQCSAGNQTSQNILENAVNDLLFFNVK